MNLHTSDSGCGIATTHALQNLVSCYTTYAKIFHGEILYQGCAPYTPSTVMPNGNAKS